MTIQAWHGVHQLTGRDGIDVREFGGGLRLVENGPSDVRGFHMNVNVLDWATSPDGMERLEDCPRPTLCDAR